jgi:hypothetical protein
MGGSTSPSKQPDLMGGDLLGFGSDDNLFGNKSHTTLSHKFSSTFPSDFAESITVQESEYVKLINEENPCWKKMIPGNMKEGPVYEDFGLTVFGKFNFQKYDGKIILELQSKGDNIS